MPGLTAKVFRTFNASITFQNELLKTNNDTTIPEKILAYNRANRQVAILCNHQRAVSKGHGGQVTKIQDKILLLKYEVQNIKDAILEIDPKLKKTRTELCIRDEDLTPENVERCEVLLKENRENARKAKIVKLEKKKSEEMEGAVDGYVKVEKGVDDLKDADAGIDERKVTGDYDSEEDQKPLKRKPKSKKNENESMSEIDEPKNKKKARQSMQDSPDREKKPLTNLSLDQLEKKLGMLTERVSTQQTQLIDKVSRVFYSG